MELKKYVLLENKTIINNRWGLWLRDNDIMVIDGVDKPREICVMLKTSDNILDLVEVGDLVECTYHHESSDNGEWIEKPLYYIKGISDIYFHLPVFSLEKTHKYITALFKRQPNGDYKRYEVKA